MTTATATAKKITRSTFKSFITKNRDSLLILVASHFDGMTDGCEQTGESELSPVLNAERPGINNCGLQGVWLVLQSRDWFSHYENEKYVGIHVSNCCGSFTVAVAK